MSVRLEARVVGYVQGVGFRYATVRAVGALGGITGYVRNDYDGSVVVVAEGEPGQLKRLEAWLQHGPAGAAVRRVESRYAPATDQWSSFEVEF